MECDASLLPLNPPRRWTDEEDRALLAMTAAGKTQHLIARELGRTEVAVNARASVLAARARKASPDSEQQ